MASQIIQGSIVEVPLPSNYPTQQCLPLVVQVPSSNLADYMLKSIFALNGSPGIVDHAVLADTATAVDWAGVQNPPPFGDMFVADYASNGMAGVVDESVFAESLTSEMQSEGIATISAGNVNGDVLFLSTVPNPTNAVYSVRSAFLYDSSQSPAPSGMVHLDVWDPVAAQWDAMTASIDISGLNSGQKSLIIPNMLTIATKRTFQVPVHGIQWRLVLDTAPGIAITFRVGMKFYIYAAQAL